jgi:hypothetical protein
MIVHGYLCETDSELYLMVPHKGVPEEAKKLCRGGWKYSRELDFEATDFLVGVDAKKAADDILHNGFHVGRYEIRSETRVLPVPPASTKKKG